MVRTYKKSSPVQLSAHYSSCEFRCGLGRACSCTDTLIDDQLPILLEKLYDHFGVKPQITSGYRCPTYNASVGGASGSYHSRGQATDIQLAGIAPRTVAAYCESIGIKGIGLYETSADGYFVHIDTRTYKSFWYGQKQQPRTTFANLSSASAPAQTASVKTSSTGNLMISGESIKTIQQNLIALGYSCGSHGADGDYGPDTKAAVKKFQADAKIGVDGIIGPKTLDALRKALNEKSALKAGDTVTVTAVGLNIRKDAGISNAKIGLARKGDRYTLTEIKDGWGKLQEKPGWVALEYVEKIK